MGFFSWLITSIINIAKDVLTGLDMYMAIPVATKIILMFILSNYWITQQVMYTLIIGILSFFFSNMFYLINNSVCTFENTNLFGVIIKAILDSFLQYGAAFFIPGLIKFIPILGMIVRILTNLPFYLGDVVEFILWIVGYSIAYSLSKGGSNDNETCKGGASKFKRIISIMAIIYVLFKELGQALF